MKFLFVVLAGAVIASVLSNRLTTKTLPPTPTPVAPVKREPQPARNWFVPARGILKPKNQIN